MNKSQRLGVSALIAGEPMKVGNVQVEPAHNPDGDAVGHAYKLFGHTIAVYYSHTDRLYVQDAGYQTVTTKSHLNAILSKLAPEFGITQRKFVWYLAENTTDADQALHPWNGRATFAV